MKWRIKRDPAPKCGDTRHIVKFCWKPTEAGDYIVWLGNMTIWERYFQPAGGSPGWWSEFKREPTFYM